MNTRHHADEEVEAYAIASLDARANRFAADARDADLTVGLVSKRVVHVVGQLTMDADWLHAMQQGVSGSFEHLIDLRYFLPTVPVLTSILVTGASPFSGTASTFSITAIPLTTRPKTVYFPSRLGVRASTMKNELLALAGS